MYPVEWLDTFQNIDFEGKQFRIVKEYDKYLTQHYGDYMKFPPENERVPIHSFDAYM